MVEGEWVRERERCYVKSKDSLWTLKKKTSLKIASYMMYKDGGDREKKRVGDRV